MARKFDYTVEDLINLADAFFADALEQEQDDLNLLNRERAQAAVRYEDQKRRVTDIRYRRNYLRGALDG